MLAAHLHIHHQMHFIGLHTGPESYIAGVREKATTPLNRTETWAQKAKKDVLWPHGSNKKNLAFRLWASDKPTPVP